MILYFSATLQPRMQFTQNRISKLSSSQKCNCNADTSFCENPFSRFNADTASKVQRGFSDLAPLLGPSNQTNPRFLTCSYSAPRSDRRCLFDRATLGAFSLFVLAHTYAKIACFLIMRQRNERRSGTGPGRKGGRKEGREGRGRSLQNSIRPSFLPSGDHRGRQKYGQHCGR